MICPVQLTRDLSGLRFLAVETLGVDKAQQHSAAEIERMMKLQDVLLKAMAKKISFVSVRRTQVGFRREGTCL